MSEEIMREKERTYLDDAHIQTIILTMDFGMRHFIMFLEVLPVIIRKVALGAFEKHVWMRVWSLSVRRYFWRTNCGE